MEDTNSPIHYHTSTSAAAAAAAAPLSVPDDPTQRLSVLSSLTITGGFNLWETARSTGSNDAVEHSTQPSPLAPHPLRSAPYRGTKRAPSPVLFHNAGSEEEEKSDVLWHRPPPPPPPEVQAAPRVKETPAATAAGVGRSTRVERGNGHALAMPSERADAVPVSNPRRRTVRPTTSSAKSANARF